MPRGLFAGLVAIVVAMAGSACGAGASESTAAGGKLSADELEHFLVEAHPDGPTYDCRPTARDRWDYVCTFTDDAGARMSIDVLVNDEQAVRSSGVYAAESVPTAEEPGIAAPPKKKWVAQVNRLCRWAKGASTRVGQPRTLADFEAYVVALRAINERYRKKLAALPAAPGRDDRATFETLLRLLEEDRRLATELLSAIRAEDRAAMTEYFGRLQMQAAEANTLFARMGTCPAA